MGSLDGCSSCSRTIQNVRFTVKVQITNRTESAIRYTSMPEVRMTILDGKGSPAPFANVDGNTIVPDPTILTIPPKAIVTISSPKGSLVTSTYDSAVLAARLLRPGKWTLSAAVARERGGDELGGWYGVLIIPSFDVALSRKDLDTADRILEEMKTKPAPAHPGDGKTRAR